MAHSLGRLVAVPHHLLPDILELLTLGHEPDVRLTKVVAVTGVTQLLELVILVVLITRQIL